ncbi:DUF6946 family protein [Bacillus sp. EB600]|uniref:DUF6946 family protein n=1 Tax=Bacillus sp. EB600 TaxID=2806345 RepID=UPI00210C6DF9|nr:DUF1643 domain-containing protein [Bacillus sp. EB600]MCQ6281694.1 DUF1643 domain-containing protein [Bacillus sp. EB600]
MNEPRAIGTFLKDDGKILRSKTRLQWGESKQSIGSVIMLNPGSATLKSNKEWVTFLNSSMKTVSGELSLDPTMKQLSRMIREFYSDNKRLEGSLYIYNLFPLRDPDMESAKKEFTLVRDKVTHWNDPIIKECLSIDHPWFLLAWGCGHPPAFELPMNQWYNAITNRNSIIFGRKGKKEWDYYHPSPPVQSGKDKYLMEIKELYHHWFKGTKDDEPNNKGTGLIFIPSNGPEDWGDLLANKVKQFKTGYSAKTLAYSWEKQNGFPRDVESVFHASGIELFKTIEMLLGIPEYRVPLPGGSRASQNDIFVLAKGKSHQQEQLVAIAVEGKVSEDFGQTTGAKLGQEPSSGLRKRVNFLLETLGLDKLSSEELSVIRYQLLHRTVSSILLAKKFTAPNAVVLVHSFSEKDNGYKDYEMFLALFNLKAFKNRIIGPVNINEINVYFGWVCGKNYF